MGTLADYVVIVVVVVMVPAVQASGMQGKRILSLRNHGRMAPLARVHTCEAIEVHAWRHQPQVPPWSSRRSTVVEPL